MYIIFLVILMAIRWSTQIQICSIEEMNIITILNCNGKKLGDNDFIETLVSSVAVYTNTKKTTAVKNLTVFLENNAIETLQTIPNGFPINELSFRENYIKYIGNGVFQYLVELKNLDLSYNRLVGSSLSAKVFRGIQIGYNYESLPLEQLNLGNNNISNLNADVFKYLPKLKSLKLNNNPLKHIHHEFLTAISTLHLLQILNLAQTQLTSLPESMFQENSISEIYLNGNYLTEVPYCLQNLESSLRSLNLDTNLVQNLHSESFQKLSNLVELHISGMETLKNVGINAFSPLKNLVILDCSYNQNLQSINVGAFEESKNNGYLQELFLSNNKLQYLNENTLNFDKLRTLHLHGNPWNCSCSLVWLMKFVESRQHYDPESNLGMRCEYPIQLTAIPLVHARSQIACNDYAASGSENISYLKRCLFSASFIFFLVVIFIVSFGFYLIRKRMKRANLLKSRYSNSSLKYKLAKNDDSGGSD